MSNQPLLFEDVFREPLSQPVAKARATDPESSHEAARNVESSGAAHDQRERACDLVFMSKGSTIHELAALSRLMHGNQALDHIQLARRLPELVGMSPGAEPREQRKCKVTNRKCQTWWPKD